MKTHCSEGGDEARRFTLVVDRAGKFYELDSNEEKKLLGENLLQHASVRNTKKYWNYSKKRGKKYMGDGRM